FAPLLERAARGDGSLGFGLDGNDRAILGRRHDDEVGGRHGAGDETQTAIVSVLRIEVAKAPDFTAVGETVGRGIITAVHDEVLVLAVVPKAGRSVGVLAFAPAIGWPRDFPDLLARRRLEGD